MEPFSPLSQQALPLEIIKGQDFNLPINYEDADGAPINLAGYTAKMQVRRTPGSEEDPILEASTEDGRIQIVAADGRVEVSIPASATASLPGDWQGVYDLFIYATNGPSERLIFGPVQITETVTK